MQYWLVKQEPSAYSWNDFVREKGTVWTGIRNYQARNNLAAMKRGDSVLFYHSVSEKSVVGIASVAKEAYPDPSADTETWLCVDLTPVKALPRPVSLNAIKSEKKLENIPLIRNSRLSVMPLKKAEFSIILKMGGA
jgi:predicted RNA-binding protein with PUA-like domain